MAETRFSKTAHCWYSQKAADAQGTALYQMEDGSTKHVTAVYESEESGKRNYQWDDRQYLGIGTYVGQGMART